MELGTYFELEVSFGESELLAYILAVLYLALGLTALVSFSSSSLSLSLSLSLRHPPPDAFTSVFQPSAGPAD